MSSLIQSESLPVIEVEEWLDTFWVIEDAGAVAACAGIERYGDSAVLRSVVVGPSLRGTGEGFRMTQAALDWAREDARRPVICSRLRRRASSSASVLNAAPRKTSSRIRERGWQWRGIQENEQLREMLIPMRLKF